MTRLPPVFGLFTHDGLDQICPTQSDANRERRDLIAMGCTVVVCLAPESDLHLIHDEIRLALIAPTTAIRRYKENKLRHVE